MKKFEASSPGVEVNGETILAFIGSNEKSKELRIKILEKYGIIGIKPGQWYFQQSWLNAFNELSASLGAVTLKLIGKEIPSKAKFPPNIKTTKDAFESLDKAYQANHRGGFIGNYKLVSYDESKEKKELVMECNTPYPKEFDGGILEGLFIKFKPDPTALPRISSLEVDGIIRYTIKW